MQPYHTQVVLRSPCDLITPFQRRPRRNSPDDVIIMSYGKTKFQNRSQAPIISLQNLVFLLLLLLPLGSLFGSISVPR